MSKALGFEVSVRQKKVGVRLKKSIEVRVRQKKSVDSAQALGF